MNVSMQEPKFFIFKRGFFYIHGSTNGESVVMYKLPNEDNLQVHYTFLNCDCNYETCSYNLTKETVHCVDETYVTTCIADFSIEKTLRFSVDDTEKTISYQINENGFNVESDIDEMNIIGFIPNNCRLRNPLIRSKTHDGRYFLQNPKLPEIIDGLYVLKTSDNVYHLFQYSITNPFSDSDGEPSVFTIDHDSTMQIYDPSLDPEDEVEERFEYSKIDPLFVRSNKNC